MKVKMPNAYVPRRGGQVEPGNVYASRAQGRPFFRIVLALAPQEGERPYKNLVCLHVAGTGDIVGCSMQPTAYIRDHNDLVGKVDGELPTISFHFFSDPLEAARG